MRRKINSIFVGIGFLILLECEARALSFFIGPGAVTTTPSDNKNGVYFSKMSYLNAEALVDLSLGFLSIESGGMLLKRQFFFDSISVETFVVHVPVFARIGLGTFLSVGAGGYYGVPMRDSLLVTDGSNANEVSYASAGLKKTEMGVGASVRFAPPVSGFFLEGMVHYSLFNAAEYGNFRYQDIGVFLGASF